MKKYVMALDQGTTSSRCILFDKAGNICSMSQKEFAQIYPKPGWVEQDALEIWESQYSVMKEAMEKQGILPEQIAAIGITNQRETTIIWNKKTGKPIYHAIVWQCRRTALMIDTLKEEGFDQYILERTGLIADAYFSASKVAWILKHVEGAKEQAERGELLFGTVDSWLIWKLTGGKVHVTDYSNASRTMLFDIHKLCWDQKILEKFEIPEKMLPQVKASSCIYGETAPEVLAGRVKIAGAAGDQQSALFGQGCFSVGDVKNTYGTGCFLLMNTGNQAIRSQKGLLTTIAASLDGKVEYALEGSVFVAGAAIQWLRDGLHMVEHAPDTQSFAESVPDSNGMYLVPAFAGMGAPYWNPYARGTIVGLTRGCSKEHFIRATLESLAYQVFDVIRAMEEDAGVNLARLKVDGGASANDFLMQFQADLIQAEVERPCCIETTALGAAYLAGLAVGYWKDQEEIKENWQLEKVFRPHMDKQEREQQLRGWKRAVHCALAWAEYEENE